jgi:putative membrane protein
LLHNLSEAGKEIERNKMLHKTERIEIAMLAVVVVAAAISAIRPHSFAVWMTEIFWVAGLLAVLLSTRWMFRFSLAAYSCFFAWMMLQTVGAHYTFELVPMDWLKEMLGLVRNPYDRIAHFTVGWFAFPFAELFLRKDWVRSAVLAAFFAVMTVVAMAGLWELVEWQYAAIEGGDAGAAFLGSQGDVWDAQKDILCDTLGALCAATLFLLREKR